LNFFNDSPIGHFFVVNGSPSGFIKYFPTPGLFLVMYGWYGSFWPWCKKTLYGFFYRGIDTPFSSEFKYSFVNFISEALLPPEVDALIVLFFVAIIYEQYEAGDGKSSTYFLGLKWSIRFDFANDTPVLPARSFAKFSFIMSLFFLSS
jgi:hypothetical protein